MAKLIFNAEDVKRVVEHSIAAPAQNPQTVDFDIKTGEAITKPVIEPSILLVHDQGVYLMSNGTPGDPADPATDINTKYWQRYCAYAKGCHPKNDEDWYDTARDLVGGDDFAETLEWAKPIKEAIDKGAKQVIINFGARSMKLGFK
jgi:hypothetical protein